MSIVHYVHNDDDWRAVYLDDSLYHEGHDIPIFIWLELLQCEVTGVCSWVSNFEGTGGRAARFFSNMEPHTLREH